MNEKLSTKMGDIFNVEPDYREMAGDIRKLHILYLANLELMNEEERKHFIKYLALSLTYEVRIDSAVTPFPEIISDMVEHVRVEPIQFFPFIIRLPVIPNAIYNVYAAANYDSYKRGEVWAFRPNVDYIANLLEGTITFENPFFIKDSKLQDKLFKDDEMCSIIVEYLGTLKKDNDYVINKEKEKTAEHIINKAGFLGDKDKL